MLAAARTLALVATSLYHSAMRHHRVSIAEVTDSLDTAFKYSHYARGGICARFGWWACLTPILPKRCKQLFGGLRLAHRCSHRTSIGVTSPLHSRHVLNGSPDSRSGRDIVVSQRYAASPCFDCRSDRLARYGIQIFPLR